MSAEIPRALPLWSGRSRPEMRIYVPDGERRVRPALVVFRGGGYAICDGSGSGTASWAARHGMVGIEVDYSTRATRSSHPAAYADAARALRLVRHHAAAWGIDPARVAALGYSAGGHLTSLVSTQPALLVAAEDDLAHLSARPDLVILGYPVISFVEGYESGALGGSIENFFGRLSSEAERRQFSNELNVAAGHPPVFVWTTADDPLVPAAHSEAFAAACRRAGVPVELVIYPHGPHALGLAFDFPGEAREWTTRLLAWLTAQWGPLAR